jgi:predicted alpha/beta hydrolase family esterase
VLMKKQVIVIHGGMTFASYEEYLSSLRAFQVDSLESLNVKSWKETLQDALGPDFEVLLLKMPNKTNAKYLEWKIWFQKFAPLFNESVILVGHSLGGTFLAKFLSEETFPKDIEGVFLIAAPYDAEGADHSLADFTVPQDLSRFAEQVPRVFLYASEDDRVVPIENLEKYRSKLPRTEGTIFSDRGHFNQETFPELATDIGALCK